MPLKRRTTGHALRQVLEAHPGERMPCSVLLARTLIQRARVEHDPIYAEMGGDPEGSSWWARANLWATSPDPVWGCVSAWQELCSREVDRRSRPAGAWCIWQAWALDLAEPRGHLGLSKWQAWAGWGGTGEVLVDSDVHHGFRDRAVTLEQRLDELQGQFGGTWEVRVVLL